MSKSVKINGQFFSPDSNNPLVKAWKQGIMDYDRAILGSLPAFPIFKDGKNVNILLAAVIMAAQKKLLVWKEDASKTKEK